MAEPSKPPRPRMPRWVYSVLPVSLASGPLSTLIQLHLIQLNGPTLGVIYAGLAVSAFNEAELREAGYARTAVVPPAAMVPTASPVPPVGPVAAGTAVAPVAPGAPGASSARNKERVRREGARWISVGRLAPNKSIELTVAALVVARAHHDPGATLQLVGRPVVPSYTGALHRCIDEMGLRGAVDTHFVSHLTGRIKPDRGAFEHVLQSLGCSPAEVVFFDDNALNIEAARTLGIQARQVRGLGETERALIELGLIDA